MKTSRGKYQGVLQIVRFNWPIYVAAMAMLLGGSWVAFLVPLPSLPRVILVAALTLAGIWLILSLLVSHYVYDHSSLYQGEWLLPTLGQAPLRYANLHVGLDEFSEILKTFFPHSNASVIDFFDSQEMTEPSIWRARRENAARLTSATRAAFDALPFCAGELEAAFLIFAAHELRKPASRTKLFQELHRVLELKGKVLLVEHLRDLPNFFAFGPGFMHFHSRTEWLRGAAAANFRLAREFACTPFVRVFLFEKQA